MSALSTNGRHNALITDALTAFGFRDPAEVLATYAAVSEENERSRAYRYRRCPRTLTAERIDYFPGGDVGPVALIGFACAWLDSIKHPQTGPIVQAVTALLEGLRSTYPAAAEQANELPWPSVDDLSDTKRWMVYATRRRRRQRAGEAR